MVTGEKSEFTKVSMASLKFRVSQQFVSQLKWNNPNKIEDDRLSISRILA